MLWPTGIEVARLPPMTVKPVPEIVAAEMFTVAVPVLVMLMLWAEVLPTLTLPKAMLVALGVMMPELCVVGWPALV